MGNAEGWCLPHAKVRSGWGDIRCQIWGFAWSLQSRRPWHLCQKRDISDVNLVHHGKTGTAPLSGGIFSICKEFWYPGHRGHPRESRSPWMACSIRHGGHVMWQGGTYVMIDGNIRHLGEFYDQPEPSATWCHGKSWPISHQMMQRYIMMLESHWLSQNRRHRLSAEPENH